MGYVLFKRKKFEKSNNVEYHVNNYQVIEGLNQIFKKTERKMNILTYVKELDYNNNQYRQKQNDVGQGTS